MAAIDPKHAYGLWDEGKVAVFGNTKLQNGVVILFSSNAAARTFVEETEAPVLVARLADLQAIRAYLEFGQLSGAGTVLFDPKFEMDPETTDSAPIGEVLKTLPPAPEIAN
jgi:hypothetical protein